MTKTEKLLRELIALPSVNPAFLPAHHPHAGEQRVADFLAATAAQAGLDVEFQSVAKGRSNVLARLSPSGKVRQRLLLVPHMDTVDGTDEQFTPAKRNGRLFGRGACDTKGSVAMMFTALCEMAQGGPRSADTEITFAGMVDEEHRQAGSRALVASGMQGGPGDCRRTDAPGGGDGAQRRLVAGTGDAGQSGSWLLPRTGAQRGAHHVSDC